MCKPSLEPRQLSSRGAPRRGDLGDPRDYFVIVFLATRTAFSALIDRAIEEKVAFIIIAGDLYDTDWKEYNTGFFFNREMARLNAVGIIAIVLYGNHDAENDMTKKLTAPPNVRVFDSAKAHTIRLEELRVALHGQSFKQADIRQDRQARRCRQSRIRTARCPTFDGRCGR